MLLALDSLSFLEIKVKRFLSPESNFGRPSPLLLTKRDPE